jgi:hypothetical protein
LLLQDFMRVRGVLMARLREAWASRQGGRCLVPGEDVALMEPKLEVSASAPTQAVAHAA